jgi:pyruvate dehydrogenase E2 component (dihydrolipoamide acetyltransferase)
MLTLVFDHRIVDGVPAARFLQDLKRNLEDPESLL